jgi:tetratricopeptide (TPR) repeat protein
MKLIKLLLAAAFLVSSGLAYAEKQQSIVDIYTNAGIKKYMHGDFEGAIKDLQSALEFDSRNKKAKAFFVKVLVDQASQNFMEKKYGKALSYIDQAKKYAPQNEEVIKMYEIITKEVEGEPSRPGASQQDMLKLFGQFQQEQGKTISAYFSPQQNQMRDMISRFDSERKDLMVKMAEGGKEVRKMGRTLFIGGIIGIAFIGVLIFLVGLYVNYSSARREALILQHQERILNSVREEMVSLASAAQSAALPAGQAPTSAREMISSPNPHIRAKGIEVIEAELVEEDDATQAKVVAEKLLQPFLEDADNRVRANAAKALFKYNKKAALETLIKMFLDENKWMKTSAAWALGELPSEEAAGILLQHADDPDEHCKSKVVDSLKKLLDSGVLSSATAERVMKIVKENQATA